MRNKFILSAILLLSLIAFSSTAYACISFPHLDLKSEDVDNQANIMSFYENTYNNETAVIDQLNEINNQCTCLTDDDINIIKEYIMNGYSVKEQTEEEYSLFLEEARKANEERPEDCLAYGALHHRNGWTGYTHSGAEYDKELGQCIVPLCGGGSPQINAEWNDLVSEIIPDNQEDLQIGNEQGDITEKVDGNIAKPKQPNYIYFVIPIALILIIYFILKFRKK